MKLKKLISWCLYVDPDNMRRLPEYLLGLKCNQRAARMHFPDWKLRLYVDETLEQYPEVADYVNDIARYGAPEIELVQCREGTNPMVERFRALLDDTVDVALVRDIDSILSRTDADQIKGWLKDDTLDVFRYREYQMDCMWSMGGGMGGRTRAFVGHLDDSPVVKRTGRGHDESVLAKMLSHIPRHRQREVVTRMTCEGTYMLHVPRANPKDCTVLWAVPFFNCTRGWADNHPENHRRLRGATVPQIVEWCKEAKIRREHTGGHYEHHRDTIVEKTEGWMR